MSAPSPGLGESVDRIEPVRARRAPTRATRIRRLLRRAVVVGLIVLVVGLGVGLVSGGPSVAATVLLIAGLFLMIAAMVSYRMVFWGEVLVADRPKPGGGPKP